MFCIRSETILTFIGNSNLFFFVLLFHRNVNQDCQEREVRVYKVHYFDSFDHIKPVNATEEDRMHSQAIYPFSDRQDRISFSSY